MASYDNEIYRGPPEAGPTLEHDIRSYGSDVYIVKSEITTLKQEGWRFGSLDELTAPDHA